MEFFRRLFGGKSKPSASAAQTAPPQARSSTPVTPPKAPPLPSVGPETSEERQKATGPEPASVIKDAVALIRDLSSANQSVKESARAELLTSRTLTDKEVDALSSVLASDSLFVRTTAARALIKIKTYKSTNALVKSLSDGDWALRSEVAQALKKSNWTKNMSPRQEVQFGLALQEPESQYFKKPTAREFLIEGLLDIPAQVRSTAAQALGILRDAQAAPALVSALKDESPTVRMHAANALAEIEHVGDQSVVSALLGALQDPDPGLRRAAAVALGKSANTHCLDALRGIAKKDQDENVRQAAGQAVARLEMSPDNMAILRALETGEAESVVQRGPSAIPYLTTLLTSGDQKVRNSAVWVLGKSGSPEVLLPLGKLLGASESYTCLAVVNALRMIDDERTIDLLIKALGDLRKDSWQVREEAAKALGFKDDRRAIETLQRALRDVEPFVRQAAGEALQLLQRPKVKPKPTNVVEELIMLMDEIELAYKKGSKEGGEAMSRLLPEIRQIGESLYKKGGHREMQAVQAAVASRSRYGRALDGHWDGIGEWLG
jgi:HEAT repeat protein